MKRKGIWRTLCTLICMAAFVLSGCGQKSEPAPVDSEGPSSPSAEEVQTQQPDDSEPGEENGEEIVFWSLLGGADGEILDAMIEEYNNTDPAFKVKHYVQDWGEYYNKLTFSVLSDSAPDVAISHATRLMQLADQKVIEPMDGVSGNNTIDWNNFVNDVQNKIKVDGVNYAVPFDFHGFLLYYNTEYLTEAGVLGSPDELLSVKDFDDFLSMLEKVKHLAVNTNDSKDDDILPLALQTDGDVPYKVWYTFYMQNGGTPLLSDDGNALTMDDAAAEKGIEALLTLYNKGYAGVFNNQWEDFKAGKAAFVTSLTSDLASFHEAIGDKLNVIGFPKLFDNSKTFTDSHTFVFPVNKTRTEEKEKAIFDFINWMVNSGKWMQTGHFATTKTVLESAEYNALPFVQNYKDAVENLVYMSGSKNCWLLSPPKTLQGFEKIYQQRESISPEDAAKVIHDGLDSDK